MNAYKGYKLPTIALKTHICYDNATETQVIENPAGNEKETEVVTLIQEQIFSRTLIQKKAHLTPISHQLTDLTEQNQNISQNLLSKTL